jgi:hypothetical protein
VKGSQFQSSEIVNVLELYLGKQLSEEWGTVCQSDMIDSDTIFSFQPLLHMCMSQLLEIAGAPLGHGVSSEPGSVLVDLPQAQAQHFLKILVQDSSLRQDIAQYMSSVTVICFSNFSSPVWTVR